MTYLELIDAIESNAVPNVTFGEDSTCSDFDWYLLLRDLTERKSYLPLEIKEKYIERLLLDEDLGAESIEKSALKESWQQVRIFAALEPVVPIT